MQRSVALESLYEITFSEPASSPRHQEACRLIELMLTTPGVPQQVVDFLEKEGLGVYKSKFLEKMKDKRFYRTLKSSIQEGYQIDHNTLAKALTSLVTHAIIDVEQKEVSLDTARSELKLDKILSLVETYLSTGRLPDETISVIKELVEEV